MANLIPYTKSSITKPQKSAIIKADKFLNAKSSKTNVNSVKPKQSKNSSEDILLKIEKKVIKIDKLLKDSFALKKKQQKKVRIKGEQKEFEDREKELEKKKPKKQKGVNLPTPPKMGFLDWIKNFITQTVLGFIAVRLIDFLPQLLKILPVIIKVTDFITDIGGKLLDGLVTFIDWGYKAYDATRGFIKNIFGEGGVKQFDQLSGLLNKFLNLAIIAGLVAAGSGGLGKKTGSGAKPGSSAKPGQGGRPKVTTSGGGGSGRPDIRNPLRQRPGVTTSGGGTGGLDIRNPLRQRPKITTGGVGKKALLSSVRPFLKNIPFPVVGALIDFGLSVALGENVGRAAFRAIGAGILAAVGAAIGSVVPVAGNLIGGIAGGILGDIAGGALYDLFFGGKKPTQKQGKTNKLAGGGSPIPSTQGGKSVSSAPTRTLKKKKKSTRSLSIIPSKIKPGKSAGGEDKVQSVFPNPEKNWWDPFGVFSGKPQQQQQKKPTEKVSNPQEFLIESNDVLGKSNFFGPFFTLALKSVLGDKPNKLDYLKVGQGLNSWMQGVFKTGPLGFAGGGEVDAKQFFSGEDYTQVIAKSVEDSVSKEINTTIRNLKDELSLKRPVGRDEMLQENIRRGTEGGGGEGGGEGGGGGSLTAGQWGPILDLIASKESGGSYTKMYGGKENPALINMTLQEVSTFQSAHAKKTGSAAMGRYQFMNALGQGAAVGLKPTDKFSPANQDKMAVGLIEKKRKVTLDMIKSNPDEAIIRLGMEWAAIGMPKAMKGHKRMVAAGETYYAGDGVNKAHITPAQMRAAFAKTVSGGYSQAELAKSQVGTVGDMRNESAGSQSSKILAGAKKIIGKGLGVGDQCANTVRDALRVGGHPAANKRTKIGDLDTPKGTAFSAPSYAASFGGSDMGKIIRDRSSIKAGDIILWRDYAGGKYGKGAITHVGIAADDGLKNQYDHNRQRGFHYRPHWDKSGGTEWFAGVRLMDSGGMITQLTPAILGEKGKPEGVVGSKVTKMMEETVPGVLPAIIESENKNDLTKVLGKINEYVSYEHPYAEPQIVYIEVPVEVPVPIGSGGGGNIFIGGVNRNKGIEATLAQLG